MIETLKFTGRIMKKRPLRSLLTILQLALGVWIVAVILSLNLQATGRLDEVTAVFGDTLARIHVSKEETINGTVHSMRTSNFRRSDLERLKESSSIETAFIYDYNWYTSLQFNNLVYRVSGVAGATPEFADAIGLEMVEGHFFTDMDLDQSNRVAVISETISKQLYSNQSALGQTIQLGGFREDEIGYEIIGVYKPTMSMPQHFLQESYVIFPLGYGYSAPAPRNMDWEPHYGTIYIKSVPGAVFSAVEDAKMLLADRATDGMEVNGDYFQDSTQLQRTQFKNMSVLLGAFAFVAIVTSSIGILTIMLVSVVERTREVGLRKALGASKLTIVGQILNESLVFSFLGAFAGLIAAFFTAGTLANTLAEVIYSIGSLGGLHPKAALFSFLLAIAVGQLFGLYPAIQAAKMPPVDALRDV